MPVRSVLRAAYKGVAFAAAMSQGFLLDALAALLSGVDSDMNDVEGIHHRYRPWKLVDCCAFVAAEPIHRDDLDVVLPFLGARGQPGRQDAFGAALHHV